MADSSQFSIVGGDGSGVPSFGGIPLIPGGVPGSGFLPAPTEYPSYEEGSSADPGLTSAGPYKNVVVHQYTGAIRADPPKNQFINMLNAAAADSGVVDIILFSAAQEVLKNFGTGKQDWENYISKPDRQDLRLNNGIWEKLIDGEFRKRPGGKGWRTGSPRHDSGLAGDIRISYKNASGSVVRADSKTEDGKRAIVRFCVASLKHGARAFGHNNDGSYMTTDALHIDMLGRITDRGFSRAMVGLWGNDTPFASMPTWLGDPITEAFKKLQNPNNTSDIFNNDSTAPAGTASTVGALANGKAPLTKGAASEFTSATGSPVKPSSYASADRLATPGITPLSQVEAFNNGIGGGPARVGLNPAEKAWLPKNQQVAT